MLQEGSIRRANVITASGPKGRKFWIAAISWLISELLELLERSLIKHALVVVQAPAHGHVIAISESEMHMLNCLGQKTLIVSMRQDLLQRQHVHNLRLIKRYEHPSDSFAPANIRLVTALKLSPNEIADVMLSFRWDILNVMQQCYDKHPR